ncbi:MAG: YdcF family protein [Terracidiphilus sp.]
MPKTLSVRKKPVRQASHKLTPLRRPRLNWRVRLILATFLLILILLAWGVLARLLAPVSNTSLTRFDAIIVLGTSADRDGNPSPVMLARVTEGVHEYERGVAPRLILTGAAASNQFTEARVMAAVAHAQGIPESAIFEEPQAMDTIQNACYAERIMKAHGWSSAEVVSSASHLPRAGIIFNELPLEWRTHAAPPLESESVPKPATYPWAVASVETLKTVRYLIWARWRERCQP